MTDADDSGVVQNLSFGEKKSSSTDHGERRMNRLLNWLKLRIEKSPIRFVMIGGPIAYGLGMTILALTFIPIARDPLQPDVLYVFYLNMAIGSSLPIAFHWFVARYERKSRIAQIIAIVPAGFFALLCIVSGVGIMESHMCWKDPATGSIECRIP